jgi:secreted trypsin-like serine protease
VCLWLNHGFTITGGEEKIDTCQGDGGSPLVCPIGPVSENRYIQVGITSWGIGCGDIIPAVYANVAMFREWIDGHVLNYGFDPSTYSF